MSYDPHAFISYAHIDNEPLVSDREGWVSDFHRVLLKKLKMRLGGNVTIWRDDKLRGNDVFGDEIIDRLKRAGLLVTVLTPRYVNSAWCRREVETFEAAARETGGVVVGNRSRVLKVLKTPLLAGQRVPPVLDATLGVSFLGDKDREIDPALGRDAETEFLQRVVDLAALMAEQLRALGVDSEEDACQPPPSGQVVYVAECGRDLLSVRAALMTELRMHGHAVLPESPLPLDEDSLRSRVLADLQRATLAVHLVGAGAGPVPDGPGGQSLVALQAVLGAAQSQTSGLPRIIWLPAISAAERPDHQAFIQRMRTEEGLQRGADLLQGDAEALKAAVHQSLYRLREHTPEPQPGSDGAARVHVVLSAQDGSLARPLLEALRARNLAVSVNASAGDAAEVRKVNAERVAGANVVLLVHGAGDAAWACAQANELRRQTALAGRAPPLWTVMAPPRTDAKDEALLLDAENVLDLLGGDVGALADTVLSKLRPGSGIDSVGAQAASSSVSGDPQGASS